MKRSTLARRTPLRGGPKAQHYSAVFEPGRVAWKEPRAGCCQNCGRFVPLLQGHHVLYEQVVRREHGPVYDPRNRMDLCVRCHAGHHAGGRRIPLARVPDAAQAFACEVLGEDRAHDWMARRYAP